MKAQKVGAAVGSSAGHDFGCRSFLSLGIGLMRMRLTFAFSAALVAGVLFVGKADAQTDPAITLAFNDFLRGTSEARFETYASRAGTGVKTSQAFEEMRQHILSLYQNVTVTHSFLFGPDIFDCIPIMQQPSVRALGLASIAPEPPAPPTPKGLDRSPPPGIPPLVSTGQLEPGRTVDIFGHRMACQLGTIPMRRITLDELARHETLRQFFRKYPDGSSSLPPDGHAHPEVDDGHRYAHAFQGQIVSMGGSSDINLWNPAVGATTQCQPDLKQVVTCRFSLSQQWYSHTYVTNILVNGQSVSTTLAQTAEVGWQKFEKLFPNYCIGPTCGSAIKPRLFIYFTADKYRKSGCYNLECGAFMQTNKNWLLGGLFLNSGCPTGGCYSGDGGAQYYFTAEYYLYKGNWWLNLNGEWVGYYPATLPDSVYKEYNNDVQTTTNGPLATSASNVDYGGETYAAPIPTPVWPAMGSGESANLGWTHAAFQRNIYYYPSTTTALAATLSPVAPSPTCYTIVNSNKSAFAGWNTYFFFGGTPTAAGCAIASATAPD